MIQSAFQKRPITNSVEKDGVDERRAVRRKIMHVVFY